jgi:hypothetical protein
VTSQARTRHDGSYELKFSADEPGGWVSVQFPRTHEQNHCVLALRRGYRVDIEACETDGQIPIPDRCYESTASMLSGAVEREVVGCDGRRPEFEPYEGVTVQLVDREGCVLGAATTDPSGQFYLAMPKEGLAYLQLPQELTDGGQSWCLEDPEREVLTSCCQPSPLGDPLRYVLCRARITGAVTDGRRGLAGFPVRLSHARPEHCGEAKTDADGCYRFDDIAPGPVRLIFRETYCDADQEEWELTDPTHAVQSFAIKAGDLVHATPVTYGPEVHAIVCMVRLPDNSPASNRVVRVLDEQGKEVTVAMTGADGSVTIDTGRRGRFQVTVYPDATSADVPYSQTVNVNSKMKVDFIVPDISSPQAQAAAAFREATIRVVDAAGAQLGNVGEAVIDSATYPVLTEPVSFPYPTGGGAGGGTPSGAGGRGVADRGARADGRGGDPRGPRLAAQAGRRQGVRLGADPVVHLPRRRGPQPVLL